MQQLTINQLLIGPAFDSEMTKNMGEAFDTACNELGGSGQPAVVKEIIAKRIINAARNGERDPHRLCDEALHALGIDWVYS